MSDNHTRKIHCWVCPGCGASSPPVIESDEIADLRRQLEESKGILAAWHSAFGTTQLTHATERLRLAEADNAKLQRKLADLYAFRDQKNLYDAAAKKAEAENARLRDALVGMCEQFARWSESPPGGLWTKGVSALEEAFDVLGWTDPHPCPSQTCDEPGCTERVTWGTPTKAGYRHTCDQHRPTRAAAEAGAKT